MRNILSFFALGILVLVGWQQSEAKVKVVASTSDLAYFASEIGGDLVETDVIAHPTADVHFVETRPSYMIKVRKADVVLKVGLELDQWIDQIIGGSHNSHLIIADCSKYIEPLEVPTFKVDARYGDIHRFGNPHYWTTPDNVKPITDVIVEALVKDDPTNADTYRQRQEQFLVKLQSDLDGLKPMMEKLRGVEVVTYHNSWPYFNAFTGLEAAGFVEPYPGVPPSPGHVKELTAMMEQRGVHVIGVEPYFDQRVPRKIADETGARVVTLYPSIGGRDKNEDYIGWLRGNVTAILEALK